MDFDDQMRRYFGTADLTALTPAASVTLASKANAVITGIAVPLMSPSGLRLRP